MKKFIKSAIAVGAIVCAFNSTLNTSACLDENYTVMTEEYIAEEMYYDSLELLALITMAEAEGEPEEGKRLVIDVILNRVDSDKFPDDIESVVYQKNQFAPTTNGRLNRMELNEDICRIVLEEVENRTNSEVIYFNSIGYMYGTPVFKVGHHYFSK